MSKKPSPPQNNLFTIFIVIVGLLVIGMVVFVNQQEPPHDATLAQGGSPDSEAEITQALTNTQANANTADVSDNVNKDTAEDSKNTNTTNEDTAATVENTNTTTTEPEITILQETTTSNQGDIQTYQFGGGNVVNVMPPEFSSLVLNETAVISRESVIIGSQTGEKITIESAKDGSEITIIHVKTDDTLYDIRGSADFINNITNYINF